jgi:hypothetical protein
MAGKSLLLLAVCAALTGCGDTIHGKAIAEPQVAVFHQRLDGKRFEEIYTEASDEFRAAAPKDKVFGLFSAIERKLGAVKSSSNVNWNVSSFNLATQVVLVQNTEFEHGKATETFTFHVSGAKAVLVGYNINSLDMLTN